MLIFGSSLCRFLNSIINKNLVMPMFLERDLKPGQPVDRA